MFVKVTDANYVRDTDSMGLSNINQNEKNEYYVKRKLVENQKSEINNIKQDIVSVKSDINDIKQLLLQLLDKK